ncbi:hypothetical protein C2S53_015769 [Perilla frutescens var. hirtella]|uniref:Phorbol-ester/DAG-type domain-containing protein n=1 Tax=Perilla frutescens var. hirtella TaxID=608512 RepID=A0AAD4JGM3_PERFH|nr:hypothetical protein C2S53_015769 [Perilla frutescens var. hirtella]
MDKKVINHLFHEHPLILRNVSELMIVESVDCYACGKGINVDECAEMVYVCSMQLEGDDDDCSINNLILHRKCGELPNEIRHPIHPQHPIHLLDFRSLSGQHRCDVCRRYIGMVLGYRCSSCDFDLDITCEKLGIDALLEERKHELQHPSHPDHPLTLMRKPAFAFYCDGCGEQDVDMAYICSTCEFWVHKRCATLPLIHQYHHHHHPLSLAFSFPKEDHFKYSYRCEVCDKFLSMTCWVYGCGDCRYFVHLKCVGGIESKPKPDSILNEVDNSSGVIQLPLHVDGIYKELITHFVMNMMREEGVIMPAAATSTTVSFLDHEKHPLICVTPISSPPYYQCTIPNCTPYFIHSICYSLPTTLQYSSSSHLQLQSDDSHHLLQLYGHYNKIHNHQNHKFQLYTINPELNYKDAVFCECNVCGYETNGMWYECEECDVKIDVKCASLPTTIRHASHLHHKPLILTRILSQQEKLRCRGCRDTLKENIFNNDIEIAYFCSSDDCDFALDLRCAQLPRSIREHQWNMNCNHPLLLTFDASLDHPSDFFCEFCEEELNPKGWMYHCRQCDISVHLYKCLKAASDWYRNIKFGRRFEMDGIHHHPLTFNLITLQKWCHLCSEEVYNFTGFECASCYYVVCTPCGRQQLLNI